MGTRRLVSSKQGSIRHRYCLRQSPVLRAANIQILTGWVIFMWMGGEGLGELTVGVGRRRRS